MTIKNIVFFLLVTFGLQSTSDAMLLRKTGLINYVQKNNKSYQQSEKQLRTKKQDKFKGSRGGKRNQGRWQKNFYRRGYSELNNDTLLKNEKETILALAAGLFVILNTIDYVCNFDTAKKSYLTKNKGQLAEIRETSRFVDKTSDELFALVNSEDFSQDDLILLLKEFDTFITSYEKLKFSVLNSPNNFNKQEQDVLQHTHAHCDQNIRIFTEIFFFLYDRNEDLQAFIYNGFIHHEDEEIFPLKSCTVAAMIEATKKENISQELEQVLQDLYDFLRVKERDDRTRNGLPASRGASYL